MATDLGTTPNARVYEVEDLVAMVHAGQIRIPEFQRSFRWKIEDARLLFDSIIRGFPLGSLLLWTRPAEPARITVGTLEINAPEMSNALWVVDGQQRLTVLANALSEKAVGDERFTLSLDLEKNEVILPNPARAYTIPLPVLFDLQRLMAWFRDTPDLLPYFDVATGATKKIRQFKIPASIVETDDESILRDIFDRMNNYGKRLTRAEVFTALHPATHQTGSPSSTAIEDILDHLDRDLDFGIIDDNTIFNCVLARRGPEIMREMRSEFDDKTSGEFPGEDADTAYKETRVALDRVVAFLREHADTPHFAFLPYRHLLVVLTRFFSHFPDLGDRHVHLLRRWYWRAATAGMGLYTGSASSTTRAQCRLILPGDLEGTLAGLLAAVPSAKINQPDVQRFRTNYGTGKIIACALWARHPRSLRDGSLLDQRDLADALGDAWTPRPALTAVATRRMARIAVDDDAARWLLIPGVEVAPREIPALLGRRPAEIDETTWTATLESHVVVPEFASRLAAGHPEEFVSRRSVDLAALVSTFITSRMEFGFEDTPPLDSLILDDIEAEPEDLDSGSESE